MLHWFGVRKMVLEMIGRSWLAIAYDAQGKVIGTGQSRMRLSAYAEACLEAQENYRGPQ
jgi:hypothetical protein